MVQVLPDPEQIRVPAVGRGLGRGRDHARRHLDRRVVPPPAPDFGRHPVVEPGQFGRALPQRGPGHLGVPAVPAVAVHPGQGLRGQAEPHRPHDQPP
jgi:hypothetical protein